VHELVSDCINQVVVQLDLLVQEQSNIGVDGAMKVAA